MLTDNTKYFFIYVIAMWNLKNTVTADASFNVVGFESNQNNKTSSYKY